MIKTHEFNTKWYGEDVGLVTDISFYNLSVKEQAHLLSQYAWVEFKTELEPDLPYKAITRAGFFQSDTQLPFRIDLAPIELLPGMENFSVNFADQSPFEVSENRMKVFNRERFMALPGMTAKKFNERYSLWSRSLIENHPHAAVQILKDNKVQGWYLSMIEGGEINLTLAMLDKNAEITGRQLYRTALWAYKNRGVKIGTASFSSMNPSVMNILSGLGAKFLPSIGCWFYFKG